MESPLGRNGSDTEQKVTKTGNVSLGHSTNDLPRGMNCTCLIKAPERHFVILKMNELAVDGDCDNSAFHVRHGNKPSFSLLKKLCGQKGESSMFSSGRYLYVQVSFKNDAPGFDAVEKGKRQIINKSCVLFCFLISVCFSFISTS